MKHGFYSEKAANYYGTVVYRKYGSSTDTVTITAVYPTKEQGETDYKWDDKVYIGEVGDCVKCQPDTGYYRSWPEKFNYEIQKPTRDSRAF